MESEPRYSQLDYQDRQEVMQLSMASMRLRKKSGVCILKSLGNQPFK